MKKNIEKNPFVFQKIVVHWNENTVIKSFQKLPKVSKNYQKLPVILPAGNTGCSAKKTLFKFAI